MVTGEYRNTIDEKGRVSIPAKFRQELEGQGLVMTRGIDDCLLLFPEEEWKKFSARIMRSTSIFQSRSRMIQRRLIGPAQEVKIDKAGRINIAPTLMKYGKLSRECVILGVNTYLEIWDEEAYTQYQDDMEADFLDAAEELRMEDQKEGEEG